MLHRTMLTSPLATFLHDQLRRESAEQSHTCCVIMWIGGKIIRRHLSLKCFVAVSEMVARRTGSQPTRPKCDSETHTENRTTNIEMRRISLLLVCIFL